MKFSQETIKILKNFSTINQNILFKEGSEISTSNAGSSILSRCKVQESFPSDFGIYDLPRFLATLSLFSDPEIEIKSKSMEIRQGKKKINYTFTEPALINAPPNKDLTITDPVAQFDITAEGFSELMKAVSVLSISNISIIGDGSDINIKVIDPKDKSGDVYTAHVGKSDKEFSIDVAAENLSLLSMDYTVKIADTYLEFSSGNVSYWVASEIE